ncbi:EamA family transporter [uncultured Duncaniella sp.]|jgi:drug/metabolite transporter (DMT)-like permease|uniref:DMT family transporter n=1 Tax=uncultured Duncaniella sp. TaxID=2768039 RepID=UPI000F46780A|nr:EamA family transporter [uncultured Duncaniella sp.]ROS88577.1 EamA/RhaT family transporter [Muribaculaceae bacterium Isolate-080 (Janvier)]
MKRSSNFIPHLFASISVIVWGVTFVSTKVLIGQGLTPLQIFVYRFALAYVCMLPLMRRLWANSLKDEICLALGGLSGGSLYFLTENTALGITFASNVSLLICTAPIFTIILDRIIWKTPLRKSLLGGSLIALVGVAVVIINGNLEFKISPLGDFLTIVAAILWAIYSIIVRKLSRTYDTFFISRKVFFYGVVSVLPLFIASTSPAELSLLGRSAVWSNIMFLGIMASMLCYMMWNVSVKALGADKASNYIYVNPLVTIIASAIFLGEPLTVFTFIGAATIIGGVFIAERCG